jgi:formylglycine-generating enzyme required for sulfatase activity
MNLPIRQLAIATALALTLPAVAQSCAGDIVGNSVVNGADLGTLLSYWGPRTSDPFSVASDFNGDGIINGGDLGTLLSNWGPCPASISGFTPLEGGVSGGTRITLVGALLETTTVVTVGGVPATDVTINSANSVTATTPPGVSGPAMVSVTTVAGIFTALQDFTYMPAAISSVSPSADTTAGGTLITITGAYLALTTGVTVGGAPATNINVVNANTITAVTPPGLLGNADVVITGGKGTITVPGGFRYISIVVPSWATLVQALPDPTIVTDPALRAAIVATGLGWRVRDTSTQMEMLLMPAGTFQMGCIMGSDLYSCQSTELPVHAVTLTNTFYLGRYEVTQSQWVAKMGSNPSRHQGYTDSASRPVETVSWVAIQGYLSATGMRLPTEAEWEYACRAGTSTPYYNGLTDDNTLSSIAFYNQYVYGQTIVVGAFGANAFGLHDMLGNVWEWASDGYGEYSADAQTNPSGPLSAPDRVLRGGGFLGEALFVRSSARINLLPDYSVMTVGFRVARNP